MNLSAAAPRPPQIGLLGHPSEPGPPACSARPVSSRHSSVEGKYSQTGPATDRFRRRVELVAV